MLKWAVFSRSNGGKSHETNRNALFRFLLRILKLFATVWPNEQDTGVTFLICYNSVLMLLWTMSVTAFRNGMNGGVAVVCFQFLMWCVWAIISEVPIIRADWRSVLFCWHEKGGGVVPFLLLPRILAAGVWLWECKEWQRFHTLLHWETGSLRRTTLSLYLCRSVCLLATVPRWWSLISHRFLRCCLLCCAGGRDYRINAQ